MSSTARKRAREISEEAKVVTVIYATDLHLWHVPPTNRRGDYESDILGKLSQLVEAANSSEAALLILGGDVFHRPTVPVPLLNTTAMILKECRCPVLLCVGDHDIFGHSLNTLRMSPLHTLAMTGNVTVGCDVGREHGCCALDLPATHEWALRVGCVPTPRNQDAILPSIFEMVEMYSGAETASGAPPRIICLHHPVTPDNVPYTSVHPRDLPFSGNQIVLCGHIHDASSPVSLTLNGAQVVIPGSVARRSWGDDARVPVYVKLSISQEDCSIVLVPFVGVRHGIFDKPTRQSFLSGLRKRQHSEEDDDQPPSGERISPEEILRAKLKSEPRLVIETAMSIAEELGVKV